MSRRIPSPGRRLGLALSVVASAALVLAAGGPAMASDAAFPNKPIRLIIPYSPGGGADNTSRTIAAKMGELLGQNVVVENRPGASGTLAESLVAQAPADGYTLLYDTFAFSINASLRKLPFDPIQALQPVSLVATAAMIFAVHPSVPATDLNGFIAHARANPGKLTYASFGMGSSAHLATEWLSGAANIDMVHVPYKGGAPALVDLVGGQVNAYFANASSGLPHVRSGKLRALAVSSAERLNTLPDVPTVREAAGFADFEVLDWHGIFLPRATPAAIVERGTTPAERISYGTLGGLDHLVADNGHARPALLIVGDVVSLGEGWASRLPLKEAASW